MKQFSGAILFVIVFFASGVIMHQALYDQLGIFVWSYSKDAETGEPSFERTTLTPESSLAEGKADDSRSGEATPKQVATAEEKQPAEKAKPAEKKSESTDSTAAEKKKAEKEKTPNEITLFNGKDLGSWKTTQYGGEGEVFVDEEKNLEFGFGAVLTGVHWGGEVPRTSNYELSLEAMKLDGYDFFCALTFPVKDSHATYVLGGWGGGVVGISSVDDLNASENETMNIEGFEKDRWYKIRVRVTDEKLEAWLDDDQMVDLELKERKISLLPGDIELSVPIGLASYQTRAQYRNIVWKNLPDKK